MVLKPTLSHYLGVRLKGTCRAFGAELIANADAGHLDGLRVPNLQPQPNWPRPAKSQTKRPDTAKPPKSRNLTRIIHTPW